MQQMWFIPVPLCRQYSVFIYFCKVSAGIFIDCIQKRIRFQRYASWRSVFRYTKKRAGEAPARIRFHAFYSLRSALTGSCRAALRDGINPPMSVKITLSTTRTIPLITGKDALICVFSVST